MKAMKRAAGRSRRITFSVFALTIVVALSACNGQRTPSNAEANYCERLSSLGAKYKPAWDAIWSGRSFRYHDMVVRYEKQIVLQRAELKELLAIPATGVDPKLASEYVAMFKVIGREDADFTRRYRTDRNALRFTVPKIKKINRIRQELEKSCKRNSPGK